MKEERGFMCISQAYEPETEGKLVLNVIRILRGHPKMRITETLYKGKNTFRFRNRNVEYIVVIENGTLYATITNITAGERTRIHPGETSVFNELLRLKVLLFLRTHMMSLFEGSVN